MSVSTALRVAVDIGGTFTDAVLMDGSDAILATTKTPTTPTNPTLGAQRSVQLVLQQAGRDLAEIDGFIHGTTLATNALIERRGANVVAITNEGFRDILEIGYERRYSQYDINLEKPDLLVSRDRCLTIAGRITAAGHEMTPLDEDALPKLVEKLVALKAEAVAICLLHAYANPRHEERLRDMLVSALPDVSISISSQVSPEAREFERLCTTVANAYIQPLMAQYLHEFEERFCDQGLRCPILMMTAGGGVTTLKTATSIPIRLVESGPAGGAILAARVAGQSGLTNVLSFDMGGTTAKLCLIDDFKPQTARRFEIARAERFIKGSGMPVRIPVLEMIEIGAGGGSIASVDRIGRIQVGPESSGSEPGPVCFAKGGQYPTVTDADVSQGLLDPERFAEGRLTIDPDAANQSITDHLVTQLNLPVDSCAAGISEIVDENMAAAGRMHAVESGKDLSTRTMIAFGGNGPLHATRVARRAGVNKILIPPDPGVGSAVGFLLAPVSFEIVRSRYMTVQQISLPDLNAFLAEMSGEAHKVVAAGAYGQRLEESRSAFMRYRGQGHEIEVPLPSHQLDEQDIETLCAAFEEEYRKLFVRTVPGMTVEILNWSVRVTTQTKLAQDDLEVEGNAIPYPTGKRSVRCDVSDAWVAADVFDRCTLKAGHQLSGPALIVEPQTTTYVSSDFLAHVDGAGNLRLTRERPQE